MSPALLLSRLVRPLRLHAVGVTLFVCGIVLSQAGHALREARAESAIAAVVVSTISPTVASALPATPHATQATPMPDPASDAVGASAGQFRIDEAGQLTYTMPLYAPPGTAGVAPQVALAYNSQAGITPLGKGWSISGTSAITRCRATREAGDFMANGTPVDGDPSPVTFSANNRFCLDGQRLIVFSGAYGAPDSEYRLETDPFTRVYARGGINSADTNYTGPQYFEVQRKDGSLSSYGNTTDSKLPRNHCGLGDGAGCPNRMLSWALNRVEDSTGNYIDYSYLRDPGGSGAPGEMVLAAIAYTGKRVLPGQTGDALPPYAQLRFVYSTLPAAAWRTSFQNNAQFTQSQRLDKIIVEDQIYIAPRMLRYYALAYAPSPSQNGTNTLISLTECRDDSLAVCYAPTQFAWTDAQFTFEPGTEQTPAGPTFDQLASFKLGDVDGDGRLDLVWWKNDDGCADGHSKLYVSFATHTPSNVLTFDTKSTDLCAPRDLSGKDHAWQLLDYDGDGRDDLMLALAVGGTWVIFPAAATVTNHTTPFAQQNALPGDVILPIEDEALAKAQLADFNGDGLLDVMYPVLTDGADVGEIRVRFMEKRVVNGQTVPKYHFSATEYAVHVEYPANDDCSLIGGPNKPSACLFDFFADQSKRSAVVTDFDADSRTDILFQVTREYCNPQPCQAKPADIAHFGPIENDAKKTDGGLPILTHGWILFTAGTAMPPAQNETLGTLTLRGYWASNAFADGGGLPDVPSDLFAADVNGDGLTDLVYKDDADNDQVGFRLNTGHGFLEAQTVTDIKNSAFLQIADIDGDGRAELLFPPDDPGNNASRPFQVRHWQAVGGVPGGTFGPATPIRGGGATVTNVAAWINLFADIDGDGATDFLRVETAGGGTQDTFLYTSRAPANQRYQARDAIRLIHSGYGANTSVVYQPLTNRFVYRRDSGSRDDVDPANVDIDRWGRGSPVLDLLGPIYVVALAQSSAPTRSDPSAMSAVHYRYAGAKVQGGGRGFLGFREITSFDPNAPASQGHVAVRTLYRQDFPFVGSPLYTDKTMIAGAFQPSDCETNPEAPNQTCFFDVAEGGFAPLAGTLVSSAGNAWACLDSGKGSACDAPWGQDGLCPTNAPKPLPLELQQTGGDAVHGLLPNGTQQPIFPFLTASTESTYDLGTGAVTATVVNVMCYEDHYGNLTHTITDTYPDAGLNVGTRIARRVSDQSYQNDLGAWRLGRLTSSGVDFERPAQLGVSRVSDFSYDLAGAKTGLLRSERVQQGGTVDQDLRNNYVLDAYGNRLVAFTCSADVPPQDCDDASDTAKVAMRPLGIDGEPATRVHRYVRTEYDTRLPLNQRRGRFADRTWLPYFNGAPNGTQATEHVSRDVLARNEFGDVTLEADANGRQAGATFGALGRPFYTWAQTGPGTTVGTTTTLRWCLGTDPPGPKVDCPAGGAFRTQTTVDGGATTWTYHDVLGRPIAKTTESFNAGQPEADLVLTCTNYDSHGRTARVSAPRFVAYSLNDCNQLPGKPGPGDPDGIGIPSATEYFYDVLGRTVAIAAPDKGVTNIKYLGLITRTTDPLTHVTDETRNALGEVTSVRDPGATSDPLDDLIVTTEYSASGDVLRVRRNAGSGEIVSEVVNDGLGRKIQDNDPDAGIRSYAYNAAGELIRSTDAKGVVTRHDVDALGRVWRRTSGGPGCGGVDTIFCSGFESGDGGAIADTFTFDTAPSGLGQLASEVRTGASLPTFARTYAYDALGRPSTRTTAFDAKQWTETTTYDSLGRPSSQKDASGYTLTTSFTPRGYVQALDDSRAGRVYEVFATNAYGQATHDRRGNTALLDATRQFDILGRARTLCAGANCQLQDWTLEFDLRGNLKKRTRKAVFDPLHTDEETFVYDHLDRLTAATITKFGGVATNVASANLSYDALGNVCTKDGQAYSYAGRAGCPNHGNAGRPQAVTSAFGISYGYDANGNQISADAPGTANDRSVTYDAQGQAVAITQGAATTKFFYGPDGARFERIDQTTLGTRTTRYLGHVEIVTLENGTTETRRYLGGVAVDLVRSTNQNETRYLFGDHLGSVDVIANAAGGVIETLSFDPHGNRRNPQTWQGPPPTLPTTTTHGFTGHEHADGVGLIHMGARLYDPKLGRFVQADAKIDATTQGLNRYSYVLNNPLSLTDPTGQLSAGQWLRVIVAIAITVWTCGAAAPYFAAGTAAGFWTGTAIVAAGGFAAGVVQTGTLQGGVYGAFSAALFAGIGSAFATYGTAGSFAGSGLSAGSYAAKVLAHGVAGGVMSSLQGGKFGSGFASAGVSAALGGKIDKIGSVAGRVVAAAAVGGTVSALTGGKFGNGAVTAAFSQGFGEIRRGNNVMSEGDASGDLSETDPKLAALAMKKANAALEPYFAKTYASLDDAAIDWASAVNPIAQELDTEITSKFFDVGNGYKIGPAGSNGVHCSQVRSCWVSLDSAGNIPGKLAGMIHTHPHATRLSSGDMQTAVQNIKKSPLTTYEVNSQGAIWRWSTTQWSSSPASQSWIPFLKTQEQLK